MRLTIIKSDNTVYIGGEPFFGIDCSALPANFHALQWYDTWGNIEYVDQYGLHVGNERITDVALYQTYIDQWNVKKTSFDAAVAAAKVAATKANVIAQ